MSPISSPSMEICAFGVAHLQFRDVSGVERTTLGVEVLPVGLAPQWKRFGVDENAHHDMTLAAQLFFSCFGLQPPEVMRSGKVHAIGHEPAHNVVVLGFEPDEADVAGEVADHDFASVVLSGGCQ